MLLKGSVECDSACHKNYFEACKRFKNAPTVQTKNNEDEISRYQAIFFLQKLKIIKKNYNIYIKQTKLRKKYHDSLGIQVKTVLFKANTQKATMTIKTTCPILYSV